ncbi:MAG: OmpA family protein [Elusimicrobiota bacterium]|jgi:outer membrane protein OmpA-like peptidoglycan-associated protein
MKSNRSKKSAVLLVAFFWLPLSAISVSAGTESNWAQQLVGPVQETTVHHNETVDFGRYNFVTGPESKGAIGKVASLEGKKSTILYAAPKKTPFELFSTYKTFFQEKGYEVLFACEGKACGEKFRSAWYDLNPFDNNPGWDNSAPITNGSWESQAYIAARKKSSTGDTYVSVFTNSGWWNHPAYRVDVAQAAALGTKVVPASRIDEELRSEGRMAFYGITFDSGRHEIKPESGATMAELAAFLRKARGESFFVVGHTDGEGNFADNMKLSQDRARSVAAALAGKYGVPAGMLAAHGVGPLSPVAVNSTAEGRALNRRVEIVKALSASGSSAPAPAVSPTPGMPQAVEPSLPSGGMSTGPQAKPQTPAQIQAQAQAAQAQVMQVQAQAQAAAAAAAPAKTAPPPDPNAGLVPVPDVMGKLFLTGKTILLQQGFQVQQAGKSVGFIRGQAPSGNTRVKKGAAVTLTVGP